MFFCFYYFFNLSHLNKSPLVIGVALQYLVSQDLKVQMH